MILEGNERGFGSELAQHLMNPRDNDHVSVHAIEGFVADDLFGAFCEAEAISEGTQCQNYLFSLSLNPPTDADVPVAVFEDAVKRIEAKLGLTGQPRVLVFHEKLGRRHAHCVWSRIDAGRMKAIKLSSYKRKLMNISRELYRKHGWDMPQGFVDPTKRNPDNYSRQEAGQAKRANLDAKAQKALLRQCWEQSDSRAGFAAALWSEGYALARGDQRGFVAVDTDGKIWSLSRWCGVKPKDLRARLGSEDLLWSVEEAKIALSELQAIPSRQVAIQPDPEFETRRTELVARQRQERASLGTAQEARRIIDLKARQADLPKGIQAVWMRVTGSYQAYVDRFAKDADAAKTGDRQELHDLIKRHLRERRALDHQIALGDISANLTKVFDRAIQFDARQRLVLPADDIPFTHDQLVRDPALILDHISHKNARFSRTDVLRDLAKRIDDPMALRLAADTAMASPNLAKLGESNKPDFTTTNYLAAEQALQQSAKALSQANGIAVGRKHLEQAIQHQNAKMQKRFGGRLSKEQQDALHHMLGANQLACVVGLAGSGKSTMLKTANDAWTRQGIKVHGAALAGKAADGLETASGITSRTLASLEKSWENGYAPIGPGDVLVVDEAGMIGTRQMSRVATKLQSIGAKLVLIGDPDQLQPIEAGTPFRNLIEDHGAAKLSQIHRQKADWQRQASRELATGQVEQAVARYVKRGSVVHQPTRGTALAALVEDYMVDVEMNGANVSRLAFAHRRKDVHAINQAIRSALRASDDPKLETLVETDTGPRAFAEGDRIVFTRNDKTIGVKNGMLGMVRKISADEISIDLDGNTDNRRKVTINPRTYRSLDHGYAVTIHKSQGATVDQSYVLASKTMDKPLTYVAMTRHRERLKLYLNDRDRPAWQTPKGSDVATVPQRMRGPVR